MCANFVGNTLTQSEAIETFTPYDVTSSRPRKTKIAFFFSNFGGVEKLFWAPEQSLNSKIMNPCNIDFNFLELKNGQKFHFTGTLKMAAFSLRLNLAMAINRDFLENEYGDLSFFFCCFKLRQSNKFLYVK